MMGPWRPTILRRDKVTARFVPFAGRLVPISRDDGARRRPQKAPGWGDTQTCPHPTPSRVTLCVMRRDREVSRCMAARGR